jgi:hypothetical protein
LTLAHAVHLVRQAHTHPLEQQLPPPQLSGLVSDGASATNEEQFERYARWLKQRREINSCRIKADEIKFGRYQEETKYSISKTKTAKRSLRIR